MSNSEGSDVKLREFERAMAAAAQPPSQAPAPQSQLPTAKDRALPAPPTDGITGLSFSRTSPQLLLASSWDSTVRLYDAARGEALATLSLDSSVLDCCFSGDGAAAVSGGMDCQVTVSDVATRARTALGVHSRPVRCVVFSPAANAIFSGSWDRHVCAWDARAPPQQARVGDFEAAGKVYSVCQSGNRVVVATSERHVYVLDVRSLAKPEQHRQSSLMHQTRCVRPFPNGAGYALSSVEGRVAIEFFDPSPEVQRANYAFKCHRADVNGVQTLFPVNAIAFHPVCVFRARARARAREKQASATLGLLTRVCVFLFLGSVQVRHFCHWRLRPDGLHLGPCGPQAHGGL